MSNALKDGGPAFPVQDASVWQGHGLSLRDYFAAKAMEAYIVGDAITAGAGAAHLWREVADTAYGMADAMLKARQQ